jgi:hypothetical protein
MKNCKNILTEGISIYSKNNYIGPAGESFSLIENLCADKAAGKGNINLN